MKLLSYLTLSALLTVSSCSTFKKDCCAKKHAEGEAMSCCKEKKECCKEQKECCKKAKKDCADGSCDKKEKKDCAGDTCHKKAQ